MPISCALELAVLWANNGYRRVRINVINFAVVVSVAVESLRSFYKLCRGLLPHFKAQGGGSIVHIGSGGELIWPARDGLSVIPKAANEALVRGIANEEGQFNIRANSVLVGVIEAGMFLKLKAQGVFTHEWEAMVKGMLPMRRFGKAEDIANAAVFLASNKANYITGQKIAVAGGFGV